MKTISLKVNAVIVTYGDRQAILQKTLQALLSGSNTAYLDKVILVDNNSSSDLQNVVEKFKSHIVYLKKNKNTGSAGGYWTGLKYIKDHKKNSLILTLDDDNEVSAGFLENICQQYQEVLEQKELSDPDSVHLFSLSANRVSRQPKQIRRKRNSLKNSFCDVRVFSPPFKESVASTSTERMDSIETAPWGGLLFHQDTIEKIGLPIQEFFVYADDQEYTLRMTENDIPIYRSNTSEIRDLCESSSRTDKRHRYFQENLDPNLLYYQIRNHTYTSEQSRQRTLPYVLNKAVFYLLNGSRALSALPHSMKRLQVMRNAIADGQSLHEALKSCRTDVGITG